MAVHGKLRKIDPEKLRTGITTALETTGILLEGEVIAQANENVDTGRHKGSITWKTKQRGSSGKKPAGGEDEITAPKDSYAVHIGSAVEYAPHLEYGHRTPSGGFIGPYPHFRNAMDANKKRVTNLFHKTFQDVIEKAGTC